MKYFHYSQKSFDDVDVWLKDLKTNSSPDIKIFLIGNKADLEESRVISKQQAEEYKEEYDLNYFKETSAKTGMNAQEIFIEAARVLYKDYDLYRKEKKDKTEQTTKLTNKKFENKKTEKGCC